MADIEKYTLRGTVAVPGVNVTSHPRCGDGDRQRAANRVDEAYARGFVDKDEAEARRDAIGRATLAAHLEELVRDIPEMTRWRGTTVPQKQAAEKRRERMMDWIDARMPWLGFVSMMGGLTGAIAPTVIATVERMHDLALILASTTIPAFGIFTLISVFGTLTWLIDS